MLNECTEEDHIGRNNVHIKILEILPQDKFGLQFPTCSMVWGK